MTPSGSDPLLDVVPTTDQFLALARSSPWRWRTLHFRHRAGPPFNGEVEAWVRRPGELMVRAEDGTIRRESGLPYSYTTLAARSAGDLTTYEPPPHVTPERYAPPLRSDGLVERRPGRWGGEAGEVEIDYDDPMYGNYTWVAMLDPVELSHHVDVRNLRREELAGRVVWRADLRALAGYDPRCGSNCCELLWSEASWYADFGGLDDPDPDAPPIPPDVVFPDHHDVALDVETGVVVHCAPVGGDGRHSGFDVRILAVDADLDALFG